MTWIKGIKQEKAERQSGLTAWEPEYMMASDQMEEGWGSLESVEEEVTEF